ncbi:MAG: hypothetical protein ACYTF0_05305 [Planctomycetota bacterium]
MTIAIRDQIFSRIEHLNIAIMTATISGDLSTRRQLSRERASLKERLDRAPMLAA